MLSQFKTQYPLIPFDPNMTSAPPEWLIENLWQFRKVNILAGYEGCGKSRLLAWLLVGTAKGSVIGMHARGHLPRTLYLCGEETPITVNARIAQYCQLQGVNPNTIQLDFIDAAAMRLDLAPQRKGLLDTLIGGKYDILVGDPLRRLHNADEDKSTAMAPILNDFRMWSNNHGLTIILLHHTPKVNDETDMERVANWLRGSTDLATIRDTAQYLARLGKKTCLLKRRGRMPPQPDMDILDEGDNIGWTLKPLKSVEKISGSLGSISERGGTNAGV